MSRVEVDGGDHDGPDRSDDRLHDDVANDVNDGDDERDVDLGVGAERKEAEAGWRRHQRRSVLKKIIFKVLTFVSILSIFKPVIANG